MLPSGIGPAPPSGTSHAVAGLPHTKQTSRLISSPGLISNTTRPNLVSTMSPSLAALRRSRLFIMAFLLAAPCSAASRRLPVYLSVAKFAIAFGQIANDALLGPPSLFIALDLGPFCVR